jgi:hypothetical protein
MNRVNNKKRRFCKVSALVIVSLLLVTGTTVSLILNEDYQTDEDDHFYNQQNSQSSLKYSNELVKSILFCNSNARITNGSESEEEVSFYYGYIDPKINESDDLPPMNKNVPDSWDWRSATYEGITGDWTTYVKNQGQCGSCYVFAAMGILESAVNIENFDPDLDLCFSEQYVLSCTGGDCSGGSPYWVLDDLKNGNVDDGVPGALLESCFVYLADDTIPCSNKCSNWQDLLYPISDCSYTNDPGINNIKNLIYTIGPVNLNFDVYSDFSYPPNPSWDANGVYQYDGSSTYEAGHAVIAVGYVNTPGNPDYDGYWICKNSWGSTWGPWGNGYFGIAYDEVNIDSSVTWVTVDNAVDLSYSPSYHDFETLEEGQNYETSFTIWNDGFTGTTLDWSLENSDPWLSYSPTSGSSTGEYDDVMVTIDTSGLSPGLYTGNIDILTNDVDGVFTISFEIIDNPPDACFDWVDGDGSGPGELLEFDASCSTDDNEITLYEWDFYDDGSWDYSSTAPFASYDSGDNTPYTVTLRVTDTGFQIDTVSRLVQANIICDIDQSLFDRGFRLMPGWDAAQEFIPNYSTLSRVDLYLAKAGSYDGDVTFQILEDNVMGDVVFEDTLDASDVPGPYSWVSVDVGISMNVSETYVVVLKDASGANAYDNLLWGWCDSFASGSGGPYDGGWFWFRKDGNVNWLSQRDWDFSFRTYGYS